VQEVKAIVDSASTSWRDQQVDVRLYYHIGATYLTGEERRTIKGSMPLGIIGSFLYHMHTSHTLTKSPLITGGTRGNLRYVNQEGFDETYDKLCLGMHMEDARGMDVSSLKFLRKGSTITSLESDYVDLMTLIGGRTAGEDAKKRHREAAAAATTVLEGVEPVMHGDDDSDVESVTPQPETSAAAKGKGKSTKRTVSTRSSSKDTDAAKKSKEK
jgi:hypothetical protein